MDGVRQRLGLPWFGPKSNLGWGWTPISWQGWAITALYGLVILCICVGFPAARRSLVVVVCTAAYIGIVVATGTKPGGRLF
jgi:hypothetical protein